MMCDPADHWGGIYGTRDVSRVSWLEAVPEISLALLDAVGAEPGMSVVDVGAGASRLAGELLARGFTDVTALDVAAAALGVQADRVKWLAVELLSWSPGRRFDVWHDRAVFHFLTAADDRDRYLAVLDAALAPGGRLVLVTFAADGPEQCSGLPTARYALGQLLDALGADRWTVLAEQRDVHHTPDGVAQPFSWLGLRRR